MSLSRHIPLKKEFVDVMMGTRKADGLPSYYPEGAEKISNAESEDTEEEPIVTRYKAIKSSNPVYGMIPPHCANFLPPRIDPATPKRDPIPTREMDPDECFDDCPKIVSRVEWGARDHNRQPAHVTHRVRPAIFKETEPHNCMDKAFCCKNVKYIQTLQLMYRHWDDIAYSFLIGGEGDIFEGRGWGVENEKNQKICGIAYIGRYKDTDPFEEPTEPMLRATYNLIMCGVKKGFLKNPFASGKYHGNTPEEIIREFIKKKEKVLYLLQDEERPWVYQHRNPNMRIFRALNFSCLIGVVISIGVVIHSMIDTYEKM